jgi:hypothetical protein
MVKWVTDSLTPLASLRRRFERLRHSLTARGGRTADLPNDLKSHLDEIEACINSQDVATLERTFAELESEKESIAAIALLLNRIRGEIADHATKIGELWREGCPVRVIRDLEAVVGVEFGLLSDLRNRSWQAGMAGTYLAEVAELRGQVALVGSFVDRYPYHSDLSALQGARSALLHGDFKHARKPIEEALREDVGKLPVPAWERRTGKRVMTLDKGERERHKTAGKIWLFRNARPLVAVSSAVIVAFVGFSVQYLNDAAFQDDLDDWLNLFLWAAAVELSGVAVLDVISRLSPGAQPR